MTRYGLIVLAAGQSKRFGPADKLKATLGSRPVICHVASAVKPLPFHERWMVVSPQSRIKEVMPADSDFTYVVNPEADGMGSSIAIGVSALRDCDAVFIALGDMPFIPPELYLSMMWTYESQKRCDIVVPFDGAKAGHPVLFGSRCFADLAALSGEQGARHLLKSQYHKAVYHEVTSPVIHMDIDTPTDLLVAQYRAT